MTRKSFRKILIANRGEIAIRVMRTCREMGIASVAVYSDADANSPHVRYADEAIHIGPSAAKDSYLHIEKIIEAARRAGADAIHPGYGFLAENAVFAEVCENSSLVFIGPTADAVRKVGFKSAARKMMSNAGVPVVPGYDGDDQSVETLKRAAVETGLPVLIKASAGGGGKGMRIVRDSDELEEAIESAARESEKSFGDGRLLIEKYVERARHIEFQIFGDSYGSLIHLFERDCSIQRRHQKIIEESPSPAVDAELRRRMGEAAVAAGRAIGYSNAGTVEFILSPEGEFYFIEVNTRLQVEHPVTEMITGLDLVRLQIEIAEGKPLTLKQEDIISRGHAIEARLYAEDPENNFLPAIGTLHDWHMPALDDGLRLDAGVEAGSEVSIYYDPMLAKIIAHAEDRGSAIRKLVYGLRCLSAQGVETNRDFLIRLLDHEDFRRGHSHTSFIEDHLSELVGIRDVELDYQMAAVAALYLQKKRHSENKTLPRIPPVYRNNPYRDPWMKFDIGRETFEVSYHHIRDDVYEVRCGDSQIEARVLCYEPGRIRLSLDGIQRQYRVVEAGVVLYVHSTAGARAIHRLNRYPQRHEAAEHETANAQMPGQVLKILVTEGQRVAAGASLIILEAMKMEQTIKATMDGFIETILVKVGDVVAPGEPLVQISAE
ncbi:MAG TPA: acetyl-CoA carboxylase biotin carboxylase subunit [Blastocatellia bacterium]